MDGQRFDRDRDRAGRAPPGGAGGAAGRGRRRPARPGGRRGGAAGLPGAGAGVPKRADCCATRCRKKQGKQQGRCKACGAGRPYCNGVCCAAGRGLRRRDLHLHGGELPGRLLRRRRACLPGTADDACGANGGACVACDDGQTCLSNGSCAITCPVQDQPCSSCAQGASSCSPESSGQLVCWFTGDPGSLVDAGTPASARRGISATSALASVMRSAPRCWLAPGAG